MALLDAGSSQSLQLSQAVKYLHSTKFDLKKAEEVFHNYQVRNIDVSSMARDSYIIM